MKGNTMKEAAAKAVDFAKDRPITAGLGILAAIAIAFGIKAAVTNNDNSRRS